MSESVSASLVYAIKGKRSFPWVMGFDLYLVVQRSGHPGTSDLGN